MAFMQRLSVSSSGSRLTPPTIAEPKITRPPAVSSATSTDSFPRAPRGHEEVLESEGIGREAEPEQVAVHALELAPEGAQPAGAIGYDRAEQGFDSLAVAHAVHEGADAADALGDVHIVEVVALFDQHLEAAVDVADLRNGAYHFLVLEDEVEVEGFGEDGMLRAERYDGGAWHGLLMWLLNAGPPSLLIAVTAHHC